MAKLNCIAVRKAVLKNKLPIEFSSGIHQSLFQNFLEANLTIWKCLLHYWNSSASVLPINILIYTCLILTLMYSLCCTSNLKKKTNLKIAAWRKSLYRYCAAQKVSKAYRHLIHMSSGRINLQAQDFPATYWKITILIRYSLFKLWI